MVCHMKEVREMFTVWMRAYEQVYDVGTSIKQRGKKSTALAGDEPG